VLTTWVTVAGAVREPFTAEVPIGTGARFLIDEAGGPEVADYVVFEGGPMMGEEVDPASFGVGPTTGLVLVLPGGHPVVARNRLPLEHVRTIAGSACTQCRDCTEMCPRYLLGYDVTPHLSMRRFFSWGDDAAAPEEYFANAAGCTGCGLCELYACPMAISPRRVQLHLRELVTAARAEGAGEVHADRSGRQVPARRLKKRIEVNEYDRPAPLRELAEAPRTVTIKPVQPYAGALEVLVREGDRVEAGQVLAKPKEGDDRAVPAYASIGGRVAAVGPEEVTIDRTQVA
jgi:Na+-translocating ferredoxin:NAD+ oxidoreductase RnfC subunit